MVIPFIPEWTLLLLNLDASIVANKDVSRKSKTIPNSVDPDETALYEPSHLDLHCLQKCPFISVGC